ncbi:MAG: hypothetical protein HFG73_03595 [Hungatella sp.]|nr:hypothetical protein [Hungatella sp.]
MGWLLILFIWLIAPFAQLGIIIALLVSNDRYKKRIRQLESGQLRLRASAGTGVSIGNSRREEEPCGQRLPDVPAGQSLEETAELRRTAQSRQPDVPAAQPLEEAAEPRRTAESQQTDIPAAQPFNEAMQPQWTAASRQTDIPAAQWQKAPSQEAPASGPKQVSPVPKARWALGTMALIMGVVFIVLAGLIFATTTWHVLPDICKACLVLACAVLFFAASVLAVKVFSIPRTGNAFYILGSIFLFLSVMAAAYFRLLGAEFVLDGKNRWIVLWAGSAVSVLAFFAGIKRFGDKLYTQACLWGMSVNLFFMAKAFSMGWDGFAAVMTAYSTALIFMRERTCAFEYGKEAGSFRELLAEGVRHFGPAHFWTFGVIVMIGGLFPIWRMAIEGCLGLEDVFLDGLPMLSFTGPWTAALVFLVIGVKIAAKEEKAVLFPITAAQLVLYTAGWITADFVWRMAVINTAFLAIQAVHGKKTGSFTDGHSLFLDICGCTAAVFTLISFYSSGSGRPESLILSMAAFWIYYLWFYFGWRQWPHLLLSIAILPMPFMAQQRLELGDDWLGLSVGAALLISGIAMRSFAPVIERDEKVCGQRRIDWYHVFSIGILLPMAAFGNANWRFVYLLLTSLYFLQYKELEALKKPAMTLSSWFLAAAFLLQPFILWPDALRLEMKLLPFVWLIWTGGIIWDDVSWIPPAQNAGYMLCLILLCGDAVLSGLVVDALLLEGVCLFIFMRAQVKKQVWWVRISAGTSLAAALFMTRGFWLNISWWVYLLLAGLGLLVFAGVMEKKRRL